MLDPPVARQRRCRYRDRPHPRTCPIRGRDAGGAPGDTPIQGGIAIVSQREVRIRVEKPRAARYSSRMTASRRVHRDRPCQLAVTEAGRAFLGRLGMAPAPPEPVPAPEPEPEPPDVDEAPFPNTPTRPHDLAAEIEESSTDSRDPNRFERAVRDAFAYLGLRAELLGGSGRTDVLLTARLGRSDTCKVTVDAKTAGSGRLGHVGRTPRKRGSGLLPAGWTRPERCAVVQPGEGSRGDGPFGPPSSRAMPTPRRGTAGTRRLPDPVHNPRRSRPHRDKGTSSRIPANARDRRRRLRGVGQEF